MIVGGIGITPARSVLVDAAMNSVDLKGTLLYLDSDPEMIFADELEDKVSQLPKFDLYKYTGDKRLEVEDVKKIDSNLSDTNYLISGSPDFGEKMEGLLEEAGIDSGRIKSYEYKAVPKAGGGY
jgi:ferredoxin-NADP reductase